MTIPGLGVGDFWAECEDQRPNLRKRRILPPAGFYGRAAAHRLRQASPYPSKDLVKRSFATTGAVFPPAPSARHAAIRAAIGEYQEQLFPPAYPRLHNVR